MRWFLNALIFFLNPGNVLHGLNTHFNTEKNPRIEMSQSIPSTAPAHKYVWIIERSCLNA